MLHWPKCGKYVAIVFFSISLFGCDSYGDSFVGIYTATIDNDKNPEEFVRVEEAKNGYLVFQKNGNGWSSPREASIIEQGELQKVFKDGAGDATAISIESAPMLLVHVPVGWKAGPFESKTGYFFMMPMAPPIELSKN